MKVTYSWLREFVAVAASPEEIGRRLSLRGLALEGLEPLGDDDAVLDFDVTANRPDCMSVRGIAREVAVVFDVPLREPPTGGTEVPPLREIRAAGGADVSPLQESATVRSGGTSVPPIAVAIDAPDLCSRFVAAVADVTIGPSPPWMQARLTACGVRPISNVVDITNYVLLERGQPMHAYDHARVGGARLVARRATAGERTTTLDGKIRTLDAGMLVIADATQSQGVAGVMGGADSEVSASTTRIVFEAASFTAASVRATSKRLGLRTEASMRFERGVDPTGQLSATRRALQLLEQIDAGRAVGDPVEVQGTLPAVVPIRLDRRRVSGLLGMPVPDDEVTRILHALGFAVAPSDEGWLATPPPWRVDMHRDVDLIEEVGRHHGFEHLPATFPGVQQAPAPSDPRIARDARARQVAIARGFSEAISFAFIEARHAEPFLEGAAVALANPLSEKFAVMRPSLVPGLVAAVGHNRRHGRRDVQLFEIGTRFSATGETRAIALVWTGLATPDHWSGGRRDADFFDLKGAVDMLGAQFDVEIGVAVPIAGTTADRVLTQGRAALVQAGGVVVGWLGQLQPAVTDPHEVPAGDVVWAAEIDLDRLAPAGTVALRRATPLPRFPSAVRDVALLLDDALSAATVRGTIRSHAPDTLVSIVEFDRYQGKGIPDGKVSLAVRLTFQSADRTLTDAEVEQATTQVVEALGREFGAVRR